MAADNYTLDPNAWRATGRGQNIETVIRPNHESDDDNDLIFIVAYHYRKVVVVNFSTGHVTLSSGGVLSRTGKQVINRFLELVDAPYRINPGNTWILRNTVKNTSTPFVDGIKIGLSARQYNLLVRQTLTERDDLLRVFRQYQAPAF